MNEEDLRVRRTRRLLREAFIELALEHGYESISVRDITTKAQVGYQTFYRHYEGKDDFLAALAWDIVLEVQSTLSSEASLEAVEQNTRNILPVVQKHADVMLILLQSESAKKMIDPILIQGIADAKKIFGGTDIPDDLIGFHFAVGMLELVRWWLEQGMPYSPEQMAEYINLLVVQSLDNLVKSRPKITMNDE